MQQEQQIRGGGRISSRTSSTSSLEVRCGCQYYQSDSLLPERQVLVGRAPSRQPSRPPSSANMQQQFDVSAFLRCSEHEYEPIGVPPPPPPPPQVVILTTAPVVRITDTDVTPVADSDDSIDDRTRMSPSFILGGDLILPLDGKLEDLAMESQEMGETIGDTSEEIESPQEIQDHLEERFLKTATPGAESRTTGEVNTSQVDSSALEELPLRRSARGLPQRIKTQAGKLRLRLRAMQRPKFSFPTERQKKIEKTRSLSSERSEISGKTITTMEKEQQSGRPSRMDRIKSSFAERPKFSLPDRSKFTIKRPNIRLPNALKRVRKPPVYREQHRSNESTVGDSRRNIFDFSTYPRIFDRKSKSRGDYSTSSPKESRAQSTESATYPRFRKSLPLSARWAKRDESPSAPVPVITEDSHYWRRSSVEETTTVTSTSIPWQLSGKHDDFRGRLETEADDEQEEEEEEDEEEMQYMDYEANSMEISDRRHYRPKVVEKNGIRLQEQKFDDVKQQQPEECIDNSDRKRFEAEEQGPKYDASFVSVDPRRFESRAIPSDEEEAEDIEEEEEMEEEDEEYEEERDISSAPSDREQQSSGSSYDRRRHFTTDMKDYFNRRFEVMDIMEPEVVTMEESMIIEPPVRPTRRKVHKRKETESVESYDVVQPSSSPPPPPPPPVRPKRERMIARPSEEGSDELFQGSEKSDSASRHRVIYQAESDPRKFTPNEPLDDIVIVKPARRKSRSSLRSRSQPPVEVAMIPRTISTPETIASSILFDDDDLLPIPPVVPARRRKRALVLETRSRDDVPSPFCNGDHRTNWQDEDVVPRSATIAEQKEQLNIITDVPPLPIAPVPPKRRSRSRTISLAQDEDRTSHGAESLPEAGFIQDDIPPDETDSMFGEELPGYAFVEKREKTMAKPPPRRRRGRDKFATTPRPTPPRRPHRAYSTLMSPTRRMVDINATSEASFEPDSESTTPYIEIDADDRKDFRDEEVLSKIQGRPLPAPPRPPRIRRELRQQEYSATVEESTIAIQTDPLPDDMIIEEEVTQAKLVVTPSISGSQIMVSTERIPSPGPTSPSVPPLPVSGQYDRTTSPSAMSLNRNEVYEDASSPPPEEEPRSRSLRSAPLFSEDTLRVSSLEVGDLKVDRLSVSQLETHKILASEVDAIVISASELKNLRDSVEDSSNSLSPSIIKELIAIRSHLESVAASHVRESFLLRDTTSSTEVESQTPLKSDIPVKGPSQTTTTTTTSTKDSAKEESTFQGYDPTAKTVTSPHVLFDKDALVSDDFDTKLLFDLDVNLIPITGTTIDDTTKSSKALSTSQRKASLKATFEVPSLQEEKAAPPSQVGQAIQIIEESRIKESPNKTDKSTTYGDQRQVDKFNGTIKFIDEKEDQMRDHKQLNGSTEKIGQTEEEKDDSRKSRSSSPHDGVRPVRQTASPIRSLPPVISVTPDTPDTNAELNISKFTQPQRAVISYSAESDQTEQDNTQETSQSSIPRLPVGSAHFIAFPASQIPTEFFSLAASSIDSRVGSNEPPGVLDSSQQLLRALRNAGAKAMRHFLGYVVSSFGAEDSREKIRDLELALCAFLLVIAALLIVYFSNTRTVTHHHHWDYFNPPQ